MDAQIIKTGGDDVVVLARRDYEALLARAGDPVAEDAMTSRILADTKGQIALPAEVIDAILDGKNPVAVLLKHRDLTQAELALTTQLSQPFISKLVRGEVGASRRTVVALAEALKVSTDVFDGLGG